MSTKSKGKSKQTENKASGAEESQETSSSQKSESSETSGQQQTDQEENFNYAETNQNKGRSNQPNRGKVIATNADDPKNSYGYNQGRNSTANIGGRAYGQNYGGYHEGSYRRRDSNQYDFRGRWDEDRPRERYEDEGDYYRTRNDSGSPGQREEGYRDNRGEGRRGYDTRGRNEYYQDNDWRDRKYSSGSRGDDDRNENRNRTSEDYDRGYRDGYNASRYEYMQDGYQTMGQTEGFGWRKSGRHYNDWEREDEYRGGHVRRGRGVGRYGSR